MRTYQTRRITRKFAPLHFKEQKKEKNTPYLQRKKIMRNIRPLFTKQKNRPPICWRKMRPKQKRQKEDKLGPHLSKDKRGEECTFTYKEKKKHCAPIFVNEKKRNITEKEKQWNCAPIHKNEVNQCVRPSFWRTKKEKNAPLSTKRT